MVTPEHVALDWLHKHSFAFLTPTVLHAESEFDRSFTIERRISGKTLSDAWPTMNDEQKEHYVGLIVDRIIVPLAEHRGDAIIGVDGNWFTEPLMASPWPNTSLHPEVLKFNCQDMGLDTSDLVLFAAAALAPESIIIAPDGAIGIDNLEGVGYAPRSWISTQLLVWGALLRDGPSNRTGLTEYRDFLAYELRKKGFKDVMPAYQRWRRRLHMVI